MKIVHYFLLFLTGIAMINVPVDAMKRLRDPGVIKLRCTHLEEFIEVPEAFVKHSTILSNHIKKSPLAACYPIPVDVTDHNALLAIVKLLSIIEAGQEVKNKLLEYLFYFSIRYSPQNRIDLENAGRQLEIKQLCDSFEAYPEYARNRVNGYLNQKLDRIIQEANNVFTAIEDKKNSAIIIDVDQTALADKESYSNIEINGVVTCIDYFPALEKVRNAYKQWVSTGFKIFFLTARKERVSLDLAYCDIYEATAKNLKEEGYDQFEQVICVPHEKHAEMWKAANADMDAFVDLLAQWKESERAKIAQKYTIAGTLDDTEENLQGEHVGHAVLIPRFF